jgi:hypothetical protein
MSQVNKVIILGLTGKKRSGKDTVADYLINNYGFTKLSFAEPLKKVCVELFDLSDNQVNGSDKEKEIVDSRWGYSARQLMQIIGTELFRNNLPKYMRLGYQLADNPADNSINIWVHILHKKIISLQEKGINYFVISDVRFLDEINLIQSLGGYIIKLNRVNDSNDTHISETELDNTKFEYNIENNGTIDELYKSIKYIVERFERF